MRNTAYLLLASIIFTFSCSEKKIKTIPLIEGKISGMGASAPVIYLIQNGQSNHLDTAEITSEGSFSISKNNITEVGFYTLLINKQKINLFLSPDDYINIWFDNNDVSNCKSNNSPVNSTIWALEKNTQQFASEMDKLTRELLEIKEVLPGDSSKIKLYQKREKLINQYKNKALKIGQGTHSNVVQFLMLNQKHGNVALFPLKENIQLFLDNAEKLNADEKLKKLFASYDEDLMKAYSIIRAKERYDHGGIFPSLKARTNWNEKVSLKETGGDLIHIVLWNGNDLLDDKKLKQTKSLMYRYGNKGLKTMMVAYTLDKEMWLNSIKQNRLPYWHLIDTTALQSSDLQEMGITSLPCNFMVDTAGVIYNRNVWDEELSQSISANLKK